MVERLSSKTIIEIPDDVAMPTYDRASIRAGIVHLGIGAFHRAHQAVYIDSLLDDHPEWGIVGASLRRPDTKDALDPQDGLYTLAVRDGHGTSCHIVGSVLSVIDATQDGEDLLELMASPDIRVISLTVTEKGYCHDPATGELDEDHADIVHDLKNPAKPRSAPGFIVEAIARRHAAGIAPFAVMSCDNLPANGQTCGRIVKKLAQLRDPALGDYVKDNVSFPGTMVDRIVPATTDEDREMVAERLSVEDAWPIVTEPFTQWVIEDDFPNGRPPFEEIDVRMVEDVEPFELMKLRMLNGSHSSLAYLGYLAGYETVAETVADKSYRSFISDLMTEEIVPTLDLPDVNLTGYREALIERFENPALKHRTWQIAMDGSQKLPQRLLGTIRDRIAAGRAYERLALGVAAWMRYASGTDENNSPIDVRDPLADRFEVIVAAADNDPALLAGGFLALDSVFGDLADNQEFCDKVTEKLEMLYEFGAKATLAKHLS